MQPAIAAGDSATTESLWLGWHDARSTAWCPDCVKGRLLMYLRVGKAVVLMSSLASDTPPAAVTAAAHPPRKLAAMRSSNAISGATLNSGMFLVVLHAQQVVRAARAH